MTDKSVNIEKRLLSFLKEQHLIAHGQKVILAVSGGLDSIAMLQLFCEIRKEHDIELFVLHLNHDLRGEESDEDQVFALKFVQGKHVTVWAA